MSIDGGFGGDDSGLDPVSFAPGDSTPNQTFTVLPALMLSRFYIDGCNNGEAFAICDYAVYEPTFVAFGSPMTQAPLSPKDQQRYDKLRSKALTDMLNPECLSFLVSKGIDPTGFELTLLGQQAYNGSRSTMTQGAAGVYITSPNQSIAQGFQNPGPGQTVDAAASITSDTVYFHQGGFLSGLFGNGYIQEGTIEHEALHNYLQIGDPALQAQLGFKPNPNDTTNITQALKDNHCSH